MISAMMKLPFVAHFVCVLAVVSDSAASLGSLQKMVAQRQRLVSDMDNISDGLERSRTAKNQIETELFLDQLDRIVWPKIVDLSWAIYDSLVADDELDKELKARRCKSPDDTFYPPWKRCVPYQGRRLANPCPTHQQLYDGPDNVGICDCITITNGSAFLYSDRTKQCHRLYTQGPCGRGRWWIVNDRTPACQIVPKGCPADGRHVYGSAKKRDPRKRSKSSAGSDSSRCWRLHSRGPCREGQRLELDGADNSIHCRSAPAPVSALPSIAVAPRRVRPTPPLRRPMNWCPLGSYRDRSSKCAG